MVSRLVRSLPVMHSTARCDLCHTAMEGQSTLRRLKLPRERFNRSESGSFLYAVSLHNNWYGILMRPFVHISQDNVKNTVSSCLLIIVILLKIAYEMV